MHLALALALALVLAAAAAAAPAMSSSSRVKSGTLSVRFSPAVYAALTESTTGSGGDSRTVTALAPAASPARGAFSFPVSGGRIDPVTLTGGVRSSGGLEFTSVNYQLGRTSEFKLRALALNLDTQPAELLATFIGATTARGVAIATLGERRARHGRRGRSLWVDGLILRLTSAGAEVANDQSSGFRPGEVVGSASLRATARS